MSSDADFKGYGVTQKGVDLVPISFKPHPLSADDVEIKVTHCGICHSDVHQMTSGWGDSIYPLVPGHEIVGHVVAKGANVTKYNIGDRVGVGANCHSCLQKDCDACTTHREPYCEKKVDTYNDRLPDGYETKGGYADKVRCHQHFVVSIPESLSSEGVAPLLCAGITTYSPFKRYGVKAGDKVGVLGIGGLGHMGLQWARAFGCHVVALSSSDSKKEECKKLGADEYWNISDAESLKSKNRTLDFVLATNSSHVNWDSILNLLKIDATCCLVGLPEGDLTLPMFTLLKGRRSFTSSAVGSPHEIQEMLNLAAEKKIEAWVEVFPLKEVNTAVQKLIKGDPRFRYVLKMDQ